MEFNDNQEESKIDAPITTTQISTGPNQINGPNEDDDEDDEDDGPDGMFSPYMTGASWKIS